MTNEGAMNEEQVNQETPGRQQGRCPLPEPNVLDQARQALARHRLTAPVDPIDKAAVLQALEYPRTEYFITTSMYWDCECPADYHRPKGMDMCENCGTFREDSPDSRINELKLKGVHLDLAGRETVMTLEEHNANSRRRNAAAQS